MRWIRPENGAIRHKKTFLFFPLSIDNETRWLEFCTVKQEYVRSRHNIWENKPGTWVTVDFVRTDERA